MKIMILATIILNANINAQTLKESEHWFLSKLNQHVNKNIVYSDNTEEVKYYKNIKFTIRNSMLIIHYETAYVKSKTTKVNKYNPATIKIPLWAIIDINPKEGFSWIDIVTSTRVIKEYENGEILLVKNVELPVWWDSEDNLLDRLSKALKEIQKYYSKPESHEPF